jgi:streptogramin lyase
MKGIPGGSRRSVIVGCLVAVATWMAFGVSVANADPNGVVTEYTQGLNSGSRPGHIAPGPDGSMWFTDDACVGGGTCAIGRISRTGQIQEFDRLAGDGNIPDDIAMGPDGNMWFTENENGGAIGRITPAGHITLFTQPHGLNSGAYPTDIALGPDGNMWFTDQGYAYAAIGRITPAGQITEFNGTAGLGIAPGPDGQMWFTSGSSIDEIDGSGNVSPVTSISASSLGEIIPGPDGNMWFVDTGKGDIGDVTPAKQAQEYSADLYGTPQGLGAGADGNVWFTDNPCSAHNGCAIGVITPAGSIHEFTGGLPGGTAPQYIAPGPDGNMWFTDPGVPAIGKIGTGAPSAIVSPVVSGNDQAGSPQTCGGWPVWAGVSPSASFAFDTYQWLLDGSPIAGQTGSSYTPGAGDVGHSLSCSATVTYPKPYLVTTSGTSAPVTVQAASNGGGGGAGGGGAGGGAGGTGVPATLGASISELSTHGPTLTFGIRCQGPAGQNCAGSATLTVHEQQHGSTILAVTARKKGKGGKPKTVTRLLTVGSGSFSVPAGQTTQVQIVLSSAGRQLLTEFYSLNATLTFTGTSPPSRTVKFAYPRITSPVFWSDQWNASSTTFQSMTASGIPRGGQVTLKCSGQGCPFGARTQKTRGGRANLSKLLAGAHLAPGARLQIAVTAPDRIAEVVTLTIRSGAEPLQSGLCEPPGTSTPQRCR